MASSLKPKRDNGKGSRAPGAAGKGRAASRACVRALIGAAAALVPVSCSSTEAVSPVGGSAGATTTSFGSGGMPSGTGGMPSGTGGVPTGTGGMHTGTGGMLADAGDASDGTLVDLDGEADSPYIPPDASKSDSDIS